MDKTAFQNIQKKLGLTNEGIANAMGIELFTVQMWACGNWPIPEPMVKFLHTLLSMKRDNEAIYMAGYGRGHISGYKRGHHEGGCKKSLIQTEGYTEGYDDGYGKGLKAGRVERYEAIVKEGYMATRTARGLFR